MQPLDVGLPTPLFLELFSMLDVSPRRPPFHQLIGAETRVCHSTIVIWSTVFSTIRRSLPLETIKFESEVLGPEGVTTSFSSALLLGLCLPRESRRQVPVVGPISTQSESEHRTVSEPSCQRRRTAVDLEHDKLQT